MPKRLLQFRSINIGDADSDLLPLHQQRQRIPVVDGYNTTRKVACAGGYGGEKSHRKERKDHVHCGIW
ncbi:MAG: hypothetical protein HY313_00385 [Acidobacteria bacterium]|nr:hypothetical protein [Acidobacteriota bacterium]